MSYDQHVVLNFTLVMVLIKMSFEQHVVLYFELTMVLIKRHMNNMLFQILN